MSIKIVFNVKESPIYKCSFCGESYMRLKELYLTTGTVCICPQCEKDQWGTFGSKTKNPVIGKEVEETESGTTDEANA